MERLILPLPPTNNHSHINIRRGNRLMRVRSQATKQYMHDAYWLAVEWRQKNGWTIATKDTRVTVRYWTWMPDRRRRDPSNLVKIMLDSLTGALWEDDQFVLPHAMGVEVDKQNPRVELEFEVMEG